ncbi:MAG: hypothetical protein IPG56_17920 [Caulobacteraceae bacterium]|nr:hypothetical protein [Caulobacteraceae bacterium]
MHKYVLAPHVHACIDGDWLIFLDLKSNRYFAVSAAQSAAIDGIANAPTTTWLSKLQRCRSWRREGC